MKRTGFMSLFSREVWPEERQGHAAVCVCNSVIVIMGGKSRLDTVCDCWIYDFTTEIWKRVNYLCCKLGAHVLSNALQLPLPESVTARMHHSLSVLQISPIKILLVVFGGRKSFGRSPLSNTIVIEFSEYLSLYNSDIIIAQTMCLVQAGDCQWRIGKVVEGASLADNTVYQKMKSVVDKDSTNGQLLQRVVEQLVEKKKQVRHLFECLCIIFIVVEQVRQLQERANGIEHQLTKENQRLMHEKEQV